MKGRSILQGAPSSRRGKRGGEEKKGLAEIGGGEKGRENRGREANKVRREGGPGTGNLPRFFLNSSRSAAETRRKGGWKVFTKMMPEGKKTPNKRCRATGREKRGKGKVTPSSSSLLKTR